MAHDDASQHYLVGPARQNADNDCRSLGSDPVSGRGEAIRGVVAACIIVAPGISQSSRNC